MWLDNPFALSLYRDADVEGMTDGWDDRSAYGHAWLQRAGAAPSLRLSARNSGLFYVRATAEAARIMATLKRRMESEAVWDQTAYNEEQWYVALPGARAHGVSARVMNYYCNLNSKTLFRFMLDDKTLMATHRPVSVHVNYHPEKLQRMQDVYEHYHGGGAPVAGVDLGGGEGKHSPRFADGGLGAWHWGVGLRKGRWCREAPRARRGTGLERSKLGQRLIAASGPITWAGIKSLGFSAGGALSTPWGAGSWGVLRDDAEVLFVDFMGQQHLINETRWPELQSIRCGDLEKVIIKVAG